MPNKQTKERPVRVLVAALNAARRPSILQQQYKATLASLVNHYDKQGLVEHITLLPVSNDNAVPLQKAG